MITVLANLFDYGDLNYSNARNLSLVCESLRNAFLAAHTRPRTVQYTHSSTVYTLTKVCGFKHGLCTISTDGRHERNTYHYDSHVASQLIYTANAPSVLFVTDWSARRPSVRYDCVYIGEIPPNTPEDQLEEAIRAARPQLDIIRCMNYTVRNCNNSMGMRVVDGMKTYVRAPEYTVGFLLKTVAAGHKGNLTSDERRMLRTYYAENRELKLA